MNVFNRAKNLIVNGAGFGTSNKFYVSLWKQTSALPLSGSALTIDTVSQLEADASWAEVTAAGYTRQQLGPATIPTQDDVNHRQVVQFGKATFSSIASGETIVAAVIVSQQTPSSPSDANDVPFAVYDITDTPTFGGTLEVRWDGIDGVGDVLRLT